MTSNCIVLLSLHITYVVVYSICVLWYALAEADRGGACRVRSSGRTFLRAAFGAIIMSRKSFAIIIAIIITIIITIIIVIITTII